MSRQAAVNSGLHGRLEDVVRGGAFNNTRDNARCGYRNRNHPDDHNDNLGFRLVLRSSHVPLNLLLAAWPSRAAVAVLH